MNVKSLVIALLVLLALPASAIPEYVAERTPTGVTLLPAPDGSVGDRRVPIGGLFDRPLRWFRLTVDGQDLTSQARLAGRNLVWTPGYDLDLGRHEARVEAVDSLGQGLTRRWVFHVVPRDAVAEAAVEVASRDGDVPADPHAPPSSGDSVGPAERQDGDNPPEQPPGEDAPVDQEEERKADIPLRVTAPAPNSAVEAVFNVQGQTAPDARLLVDVYSPGISMEPIITSGGSRVTVPGRADASGRFDIEVDTRQGLVRPDYVRITVAAVAEAGSASPVFFEVRRE